jgi:thioredoxin-dependent peroxiredoxin
MTDILRYGLAIAMAAAPALLAAAEKPPAVGEVARDFTLSTVTGEKTQLAQLQKSGPVVLLVLRGYPGYQCPVCNAQVGQFLSSAKKFETHKANVVLVYPGPAGGLKEHAQEFVRGKTLPGNFYLTLDPDFDFTKAYGLRWEAKNETAYPSTFVIGSDGVVKFAKISQTHGGRASADEVLKVLAGN